MQRMESRGLVLRTVEYREFQRIITVLTEERGLISLIARGLNKKQSSLLSVTVPFSLGEYQYTIKPHSELYPLCDATLIHPHLELRHHLAHLQAAGALCNALLASQLPGKASPALYHLTLSYLRQIPLFNDPSVLIASFLLKLLKHEGLLSHEQRCNQCPRPSTHLALGETFCPVHAPHLASRLNQLEWHQFFSLIEARHYSTLKCIDIRPEMVHKIKQLFFEKFAHSISS